MNPSLNPRLYINTDELDALSQQSPLEQAKRALNSTETGRAAFEKMTSILTIENQQAKYNAVTQYIIEQINIADNLLMVAFECADTSNEDDFDFVEEWDETIGAVRNDLQTAAATLDYDIGLGDVKMR